MFVEGIENSPEVHDLVGIVVTSILNRGKRYTLIDQIFEERPIDHFEFCVEGQRLVPGDPSVLLAEGQSVHFPDHVDELLSVVHLDMTEQVA